MMERTEIYKPYYIIMDSAGYFLGCDGSVIQRHSALRFTSISQALVAFRDANYFPLCEVTFSIIKVTRKFVPATVTEHEEVL